MTIVHQLPKFRIQNEVFSAIGFRADGGRQIWEIFLLDSNGFEYFWGFYLLDCLIESWIFLFWKVILYHVMKIMCDH